MFLSHETFKTIVDSMPLVSIDLVIRNSQNEILLGRRNNRPAQDYWFVPGGRIQKNESMASAFNRLSLDELNLPWQLNDADFLGPYEHFYHDSIFGEDVSTHYVVLGYHLMVDIELESLPRAQHNDYAWFPILKMQDDERVHKHSKWYLDALNSLLNPK